jgi:hypothetical protein
LPESSTKACPLALCLRYAGTDFVSRGIFVGSEWGLSQAGIYPLAKTRMHHDRQALLIGSPRVYRVSSNFSSMEPKGFEPSTSSLQMPAGRAANNEFSSTFQVLHTHCTALITHCNALHFLPKNCGSRGDARRAKR